MKPMILVAIPYRERLEFDFVTSTLTPLYEAQAKSATINTLRSRMWEDDKAQERLEEQNPLKEFRLTVSKMLMDDTPFLPASRNRLGQAALSRGADYIYWLDSDMKSVGDPLTGLHRLYETAVEHDAGLVSGLYLSKKDSKLCAYTWEGNKTVSIPFHGAHPVEHEVDAVGFGCALMKTDVLKKVEFPWFTCDSVYDLPEDIGFCRKATDEGFSVWVNRDVHFDHIGLRSLTLWDSVEP